MTDEKKSKAGQLLSYSFLVVFANDGVISPDELELMKKLALEDAVVDEEEKHVLRLIFERPKQNELSIEVRNEIERFRKQHDI